MIRSCTLCLLLMALPAMAQSHASADAIRAALIGNTVTGNMLASGGYAEFYAPDGSIRAADYTGKWAIKGDRMCFDYGDAAETCFSVALSGASVVWLGDGGEEGAGQIKPGNAGGW
jgi:hypothetical protein